ncbi:MAG TPA: MFS transporter [Candidatus Methylomirabilis sp.]|nr:MFS transporter [Candidatus Methylomirabilis sp.]
MGREIVFALLNGLNIGIIIMNIPPVLSELMELYGVSYTQISVLMSALLWPHAAMQLPAGMITDRLGIRRTQLVSLACMCIGNALPALSPVLGWGLGGRVITGLGTGMGWLATLKLLGLSAPGGRAGAYQAFFAGSFSLGSILAYLAMPIIIRAGWHWVFLTPAILCLPLFALVPALRLAPPSSARPTLPLRRILGMRSAWIIGIYHALSYGSMLSLGNWVPSLLAEVWRHRTATQLAWGGALVMLVSGLSRLSGGFVIFRVPPRAVAHGSILALCILFTGLALIHTPGVVLSLALLGAWFGSVNFGALFQLASRSATADSLGTLLGFVNLLGNLGAVAFTLMFGWSKDALGSFAWGFAVLAVLAAVALGMGLRVLEKHREW